MTNGNYSMDVMYFIIQKSVNMCLMDSKEQRTHACLTIPSLYLGQNAEYIHNKDLKLNQK